MNYLRNFLDRQEIRFILVGGANTGISLSTFVFLVYFFHGQAPNVVFSFISVIPAMVIGYFLQRNQVWKSKERISKEGPKYVLVTSLQVLLNSFLIWFFTDYLDFNPLITQGTLTLTLIFASFVVHKYWTFRFRK